MAFKTTLISIEDVTHDVKHLTFPRPDDFTFHPGQATEMTLMRDGWTDEGRPFTMVSDPDSHLVEFVIKIYPDHDGVTEQIGNLAIGEEVELSDPFGAIEDKGHGLFVAGGAGLTPFIPILRARRKAGQLEDCRLIFANKSERDIILRNEWEGMSELDTTFLTDDEDDDLPDGPVTKETLERDLPEDSHIYICGPQGMVDAVREAARDIGIPDDRIVTEEGW
ncbi:flavodoxin reductase [Rhodobacterales bacterium HKCCE4037]|nr:flavodoxin reductase [Rhodobacterales bacterium HKCCE4037]